MLVPAAASIRVPIQLAVNPSVSADNYTAGSGGNAATFEVTGSYTGADTLDLYGVFGTSTITVTQAQLIAGSGGTNTLEFFNVQGFDFASGSFDITGLTSASEAANQLKYVIVERNNGGTTGVLTAGEAISGLDFTAPTFSSAEIGNVDDTSLIVTFNSAMYGSTSTADWDVQVDASPATESAVSFTPGGTTVDITLGSAVTNGQTVTVAYNGTGLKDASDNDLETFTAQSVTNNVSAPTGLTKTFIGAHTPGTLVDNSSTIDLDFTSVDENDWVYLILLKALGTQTATITACTVEGSSATQVAATSATVSRTKAYVYKIQCPAAAAGNSTATIGITGGGEWLVGAWDIGATAPSTETVSTTQSVTDSAKMNVNVNTVSGGVVLAGAIFEESADMTWVGVTEDAQANYTETVNGRTEWASASVSTTENPRTVTGTWSGTGHSAAISVALS